MTSDYRRSRRHQAQAPMMRYANGSATVEFVFMAPFILAVMALVWDLREYVAYRTDLARELFVVAELIANETDANPVEAMARRAAARLESSGAGTIALAVVTRGEQRHDGTVCPTVPDPADPPAASWCPPMVRLAWPPPFVGNNWPSEAIWNDAGACGDFESRLPDQGDHFAEEKVVLPNENPANTVSPPPETEWISRNMRPTEWWVVVDICLHPKPGLFFGRFRDTLVPVMDLSGAGFIMRKRAAWGSVHDRATCTWCEPG